MKNRVCYFYHYVVPSSRPIPDSTAATLTLCVLRALLKEEDAHVVIPQSSPHNFLLLYCRRRLPVHRRCCRRSSKEPLGHNPPGILFQQDHHHESGPYIHSLILRVIKSGNGLKNVDVAFNPLQQESSCIFRPPSYPQNDTNPACRLP